MVPDDAEYPAASSPRRSTARPLEISRQFAAASLAVAMLIPMGGWVLSLSNRVAVLEEQQATVQSAAVDIAALKQQVADFRAEFDRFATQARERDAQRDAEMASKDGEKHE